MKLKAVCRRRCPMINKFLPSFLNASSCDIVIESFFICFEPFRKSFLRMGRDSTTFLYTLQLIRRTFRRIGRVSRLFYMPWTHSKNLSKNERGFRTFLSTLHPIDKWERVSSRILYTLIPSKTFLRMGGVSKLFYKISPTFFFVRNDLKNRLVRSKLRKDAYFWLNHL